MRIEFAVEGRPPRKRGEKSMWAQNDEAPFVASLREKALEARMKLGIDDCFHSLVALELTIFIPRSKLESIGDLDNFITGVCDGLQAADSKVLPYLHKIFKEPGRRGIDPKHALLIKNDVNVASIVARKVAIDEGQKTYYEVALESLQSVPSK